MKAQQTKYTMLKEIRVNLQKLSKVPIGQQDRELEAEVIRQYDDMR